ncbi:hypothetical protein F2P81_021646 [Scophthalmus maximus]|uniref:Uncharacterized protein n=1 Tax=Scophthalmus maximus TaxID=52904 RepID=A0A6A4S326_SCOMX|nr:hypothetical protein F2P81_021646 [Scophthalmus maximus]
MSQTKGLCQDKVNMEVVVSTSQQTINVSLWWDGLQGPTHQICGSERCELAARQRIFGRTVGRFGHVSGMNSRVTLRTIRG